MTFTFEFSMVLALLFGPVIGSFAGVLVSRYPDWRGVGLGRSQCLSCHHHLSILETIPLVSSLLLGRRCFHCGAGFGWQPLMMEVAGLVIVIVAIWASQDVTTFWLLCGLGWVLLPLAVIDYRHFELPHFLNFLALALGIGLAKVNPTRDLTDGLISAAVGYLLFALIGLTYQYIRKRPGLGHGDWLLMAAASAGLGWPQIPQLLLISSLLGLGWVFIKHRNHVAIDSGSKIAFGSCLGVAWYLLACIQF